MGIDLKTGKPSDSVPADAGSADALITDAGAITANATGWATRVMDVLGILRAAGNNLGTAATRNVGAAQGNLPPLGSDGKFDPGRIPFLDAAKINAGELDLDRLPTIPASKVTGLPSDRGPTLRNAITTHPLYSVGFATTGIFARAGSLTAGAAQTGNFYSVPAGRDSYTQSSTQTGRLAPIPTRPSGGQAGLRTGTWRPLSFVPAPLSAAGTDATTTTLPGSKTPVVTSPAKAARRTWYVCIAVRTA